MRVRKTHLLLNVRRVDARGRDQDNNDVALLKRNLDLRCDRRSRPRIVLGQIDVDSQRLDLPAHQREVFAVLRRVMRNTLSRGDTAAPAGRR